MVKPSLENALKWFAQRVGNTTYSMINRLGPKSYDCSSAVYLALQSAGLLPKGTWVGNTDSLFGDLEANGWRQLELGPNGYYDTKRGDVFIWGTRGTSGGSFGHTGMFVDDSNIIHSNYGYNTISINNHDVIWNANNQPPVAIYRYAGNVKPKPTVKKGVLNPVYYQPVAAKRADKRELLFTVKKPLRVWKDLKRTPGTASKEMLGKGTKFYASEVVQFTAPDGSLQTSVKVVGSQFTGYVAAHREYLDYKFNK